VAIGGIQDTVDMWDIVVPCSRRWWDGNLGLRCHFVT